MLPSLDIQCPYCGETITVFIDDSAGPQHYVEDCQVCCRPIVFDVGFDRDGDPVVRASSENEA